MDTPRDSDVDADYLYSMWYSMNRIMSLSNSPGEQKQDSCSFMLIQAFRRCIFCSENIAWSLNLPILLHLAASSEEGQQRLKHKRKMQLVFHNFHYAFGIWMLTGCETLLSEFSGPCKCQHHRVWCCCEAFDATFAAWTKRGWRSSHGQIPLIPRFFLRPWLLVEVTRCLWNLVPVPAENCYAPKTMKTKKMWINSQGREASSPAKLWTAWAPA